MVNRVKTGTTTEELNKSCSSFGVVERIQRPYGNGGKFVDLEFENPDNAEAVSKELGFFFGIEKRSETCIRVRNVAKKTDKNTVKDYFSKYGTISSCTEKQNYKNYAFVLFKKPEALEKALQGEIIINERRMPVVRLK